MRRFSLIYLLLLICFSFKAQFQFNFNDSIEVYRTNTALKYPWAGGLNYAQFSEIDYDYDGDMDLLVFDRSNDQMRVFEQKTEGGVSFYKLNPLAYLEFPEQIRYRVFSIDYNGDGKNDLFTYGIGGIKVFKNIGSPQIGLQWELAKDLLYSDYTGANLNLYVSSSDIPAIVDVDFDGDIDILTFHISGEYLQYHQNQSQELYGHSDSLIFKLKNECWGGFREDVNTNFLILNDNTLPCTTGNVPNPGIKPNTNNVDKAHSGSTVLALDYDGSGVMDVVIGDVAFSNMNLLINGGTAPNTNSLMISVDPAFPSNSTPIAINLFPAAYFVDVDFDGKKDLLVAPNAKNISENEKSIWKYKNTGTQSSANFVFETKAFLQQDMIEHGTASVPFLVDIDNDGLKDLFVSNFYAYKPTLNKESRIAYYKNTGTLNNPKFTLIDSDFINLSTLNYGFKISPSFGDLDNDGKIDILLGLENGTLIFYKNNSSSSSLIFGPPVLNYTDNLGAVISAGQYATPQIFDLDNDGKLDLIVGKKTGELMYYKNIGSLSTPQFELANPMLGNIDVSTLTPDGYPTPHFFRVQDTTYLLLGASDGFIRFYDAIDNALSIGNSFNLRDADFLSLSKAIGGYSSCAVADLDGDNKLNLFVGQDLGGLFHLEHDENSNLGINTEIIPTQNIECFPVPATKSLTIRLELMGDKLFVYNVIGQKIDELILNQGTNELDLQNYSNGIYFLQFINTGITRKIIVKAD
jgi:hypothetical protein